MTLLAAVTSSRGAFPPFINATVNEEGDVYVIFRDRLGHSTDATFSAKEWADFRRQLIANA